MSEQTTKRCNCPACSITGAIETLTHAHDASIERATELEMAYAYLRDEAWTVGNMPWWKPGGRRRLRKAVLTSDPWPKRR